MEPTTKRRQDSAPSVTKKAAPKPRRYFKGRPVYSEEDTANSNFEFPFPAEPEWEAEWKRRKSAKDKK